MTRMRSFILIVLVTYLVPNVSGLCRIANTGNVHFLRELFSKSVITKPTELILDDDETVVPYCSGPVLLTMSGNNVRYLEKNGRLVCLRGDLYIEDSQYNMSIISEVSCAESFGYKLYENLNTMPRCSQYWSFGFGIKGNTSLSKAAICYDVPNGSLKSLNYVSHSSNDMDILDEVPSLTTVKLSKNIDDLQMFSTMEGSNKENIFVLEEIFSFHTLILDDLSSKLGSHFTLFEIPFWTKLHNGNWRLFLEAFKEHTQSTNIKYNIFSGVSGELVAPQWFCKKENVYKNIPRYIWTYLKPLTNNSNSEELFVIADNSPYITVGDSKLLCEDRCNTIAWLNDHTFGTFNQMPNYGLMYCCKPEEVHFKLDFTPSLEYEATEANITVYPVRSFGQ